MNGKHQTPGEVHLQIDRLVLEGFTRHEGQEIQNGIKEGLSDLIREKGIPSQGIQTLSLERLDVDAIESQVGSQPHVVGRTIACQIYKGMQS